ncbi:MAG: cytochrome b/b6 domain-containing protein [Gemmatimonadetes bacterium]|nr:cytochrome b/b6 domain-containing protein [Gemmatimonadota bacterium]
MRRHHWIVRLTHWVNVIALGVMITSGLRIFNAYPGFARPGGTFCCYPFEGKAIPAIVTFGGWLAGARHWHFAMMWLLVANGLLYLGYVYLRGGWRDLVPRRGDVRDVWAMVRFYLFLEREHPRQGKHNAMQRGAYFAMPWIAALTVMSGLAIWKPVQLAPLTDALGGYQWARYWHFCSMLALVVLAAGHVFMVVSVDPWSLRSMITGGWSERFSPEVRNARPFVNLWPRAATMAAPSAVTGNATPDHAPSAPETHP